MNVESSDAEVVDDGTDLLSRRSHEEVKHHKVALLTSLSPT